MQPKFVVKPKFQEVEEGHEVIIDSEIVGDPLPKITWLRDGLKVRSFVFDGVSVWSLGRA